MVYQALQDLLWLCLLLSPPSSGGQASSLIFLTHAIHPPPGLCTFFCLESFPCSIHPRGAFRPLTNAKTGHAPELVLLALTPVQPDVKLQQAVHLNVSIWPCANYSSIKRSRDGILLSHKKEHIWVSPNEVDDLKPNIKSEVSQKEKNKYRILMYIYGFCKNGTDYFKRYIFILD